MEIIYQLDIPMDRLKYATDMLRYDSAFKVSFLDPLTVRVEMLSFTPGRWESFGVSNLQPLKYKTLLAEFQRKVAESHGFLKGLRFFQKWLQHYPEDMFLIQG